MSVQSEINRVKNNVAAAYAAAAEKGADTPAAANSENLASTIRAIKTTPTLQNKTVTPGASAKTVTADSGYDGLGTVTVQGDANLVQENIPEGISIFGVQGNRPSGAKVASGTVNITQDTTTISIATGFDTENAIFAAATDHGTGYQDVFIVQTGSSAALYRRNNGSSTVFTSYKLSKTYSGGTVTFTCTFGYVYKGTWYWLATS